MGRAAVQLARQRARAARAGSSLLPSRFVAAPNRVAGVLPPSRRWRRLKKLDNKLVRLMLGDRINIEKVLQI